MRTALALLLFSLVAGLKAQVITLLHNGNSSFFYNPHDLAGVMAAAQPGDTIILPGGDIDPPSSLTFNKPLVWVGAGYRPDTTTVTTPTVIAWHPNNQLSMSQQASGSRFHGIRFERVIRVGLTGVNNPAVDNVSFTRCEFTTGLSLAGGGAFAATNCQLRQCVLRGGVNVPFGNIAPLSNALNAPTGFLAENCIITGSVSFGNSPTTGQVANCILLGPDFTSATLNNGLSYTNCIFAATANYPAVNNPSSFQRCLFAQTGGAQPNWGANAINLGGNAASGLTATNVFRNVPVWNQFSYNYDYRLAVGSPAANMGGTDSGVYGGPTGAVWKEGGIPFNPHWISLSPSLGSTNGGVINVNLSGAAQQN
ncbi:MAG: hypothetical protein QY325_11805 [Flavobacteriales bacterium]|nr:MAG: hypothetical protein QY325_11805 [Flavobacteriales bacterium]